MDFDYFISLNIMGLNLPLLVWLFLLSFLQEILFWKKKAEIFDWNPEMGTLYPKYSAMKGKKLSINKDGNPSSEMEWVDKKETYASTDCSWKVYRFLLEFIGIFIGWSLLIFVYYAFVSLGASGFKDIGSMWTLILALIIGLVGIAGRILVIIESVQEWFRRP